MSSHFYKFHSISVSVYTKSEDTIIIGVSN